MVKTPQNLEELTEAIQRAALHERTIALGGNGTKRLMAGPSGPADECYSMSGFNRVLEYEPEDLTISVEAGLPWRDLVHTLAEKRQMVPLDPPFAANATVGGVVASNTSGPRRLLYGTARDMVIGMRFLTVEGKVVQSGGMVVKNVAGLDTAKLMIGSFGTLAVIVVVNFKLVPMPEVERSFLLPCPSAAAAIEARNRILNSALRPAALDLLNPGAAATIGSSGWVLAIRAAGNEGAVNRYARDLSQFGAAPAPHEALWAPIEEFTPQFLERNADGAIVRVSCTLKELGTVMDSFPGPALARAGSGVCYGCFEECGAAADWLSEAVSRGWKGVVEFAPEDRKRSLELWPSPGGDLEVMRRVKQLFDPGNSLNRGRLYNRI